MGIAVEARKLRHGGRIHLEDGSRTVVFQPSGSARTVGHNARLGASITGDHGSFKNSGNRHTLEFAKIRGPSIDPK